MMKHLKTFESFLNEGNAPIKDLVKKVPDHAKKWAKWVAQHADGVWWYYDSAPKIIPGVGWKSYDRDGYQFASEVKTDAKNWEKSSQEI